MFSVLSRLSPPVPVHHGVEVAVRDAEPPSAFRGTVAEELAVLVAPATGRFQPAAGLVGRCCAPGDLLGHVTGGNGRADPVHAPVHATIADLLVRSGQLVYQGQGLAWLRRPAGDPA